LISFVRFSIGSAEKKFAPLWEFFAVDAGGFGGRRAPWTSHGGTSL